MTTSLQKRIHGQVRATLDLYPGSWLVWCDPKGEWGPLLRRVAEDSRMGAFPLQEITEVTADELGSPLARRQLLERLDAGESLVLLVHAEQDALGWLWAQALLAEEVYARSLREQLLDWGWRPRNLSIGEADLASLARQGLAQDPASWGDGGVQPDPALLLRMLAGLAEPDDDTRAVLDRTIEATGLAQLGDTSPALWRKKSLAALLVTQAHHAAPLLVPEGHELLIDAAHRDAALALLHDWANRLDQRQRLATAITDADPLSRLEPLIAGALAHPATLAAVLEVPAPAATAGSEPSAGLLSRSGEQAVFRAVSAYLAGQDGTAVLRTVAGMYEMLAARAAGFWAVPWPALPPIAWAELARQAAAARELIDAAPSAPWTNPAQAIDWYTRSGWRVDRAGEELLRSPSSHSAETGGVIVALRQAFRSRWEDLAIRWSDTWRAARFPTADLPTAGEWLKGALAQRGPTVVIVADAFRYDLGSALAASLNEQEGASRAGVTPARAPLPSVTALGMGQALPIAAGELEATIVNGAWALRQKGRDLNLSVAAERRQWWQTEGHVPAAAIRELASLLEGEVPIPDQPKARLVLYDDAIDKLGHDDELEAQGAGAILERYLAIIGRLRDAGWRRILLTTDHGYIHWSGTLEQAAPPPAPNPAYSSRRAMAYPAGTLEGSYPMAPGDTYQVAVPSGAATFRAYGGRGYYHGGGSLQEWVIPCFKAEWPAEAKPVELSLQPVKAILSLRQKVRLDVRKPGLLAEDALPRRIEIIVRNAISDGILFRCEPRTVTPDLATVEVTLNATQTTAPRGTPVRIELRDLKDESVIEALESILQVEMDAWS